LGGKTLIARKGEGGGDGLVEVFRFEEADGRESGRGSFKSAVVDESVALEKKAGAKLVSF
jgi:hypothetical protein